MQVIVKLSGFYAGTYYEAGSQPVEMADRVAKPFMAPYGGQLEAAPAPVVEDKGGKPGKGS